MGESDMATLHEEAAREHALGRNRKFEPVHTGKCLNCGEVVDGAYCDTDCRVDHARRIAGSGRA